MMKNLWKSYRRLGASVMGKNVKVVIELNYDLDSFNDTLDEPMSEEEFVDYVSDELVYDDLTDLMRGDRLKYWADITLVDEFGEVA